MRKGMRSSIINVKPCFNLDLQIEREFHNLQHRLDLHILYRYEAFYVLKAEVDDINKLK
jgi:hypothetical protein